MSADLIPEEEFENALDAQFDSAYASFLSVVGDEATDGGVDTIGAWQVADQGAADWALRVIAKHEARRAEALATATDQIAVVMAKAEEMLAPVRAWLATELADHDQTIAFMQASLATYHRRLLADDPKRKTIKLPHGTLSARKNPDTWTFDDEEFIVWAVENGYEEFVRIKEEVERTVAKAKLKVAELTDGTREVVIDGQIVIGVVVEPGEVKFHATTGNAEAKDGGES